MDLYPGQRNTQRRVEGWPERIAWTSAAIGIVGLLLLTLVIWVDTLEQGRAGTGMDHTTPRPRAVPVYIQPVGAEVPTGLNDARRGRYFVRAGDSA